MNLSPMNSLLPNFNDYTSIGSKDTFCIKFKPTAQWPYGIADSPYMQLDIAYFIKLCKEMV